MLIRFALALATVFVSTQSLLAQSRTQNGATVGGLAGAVIGGIVGKQNDEIPEGILIGGAVGAITGGLIGKAQDNNLQRQRQFQQHQYYAQQQQVYLQQQAIVNSGVSMTDVINMSRSGVSDTVILSQLQAKGVQRRLEVSDIIALHQQGVSDTLITAFQAAPMASQVAAVAHAPTQTFVHQQPIYVQQPSVIVREQPVIYHRPPVYVHEVYRTQQPRHHYHNGRGSTTRIGF